MDDHCFGYKPKILEQNKAWEKSDLVFFYFKLKQFIRMNHETHSL